MIRTGAWLLLLLLSACVNAPTPPVCSAPPLSVEPDNKLLLGEVEFVDVQPGNLHLKARIDSGAESCALHALHIVRFERDGHNWVRFQTPTGHGDEVATLELPLEREVKIKSTGDEYEQRPAVQLEIRIGTRSQSVQVTLSDRSNYRYPLLIGRNFLRDNAVIDISRTHVQGKQ